PHGGNFERALAVARKYEDVHFAVGVHPHDAKLYDDAAERYVADLLRGSGRAVALGEIGLDYHYDNSPREVQGEVFARQLRLARSLALPAIIHSREADEETLKILRAEYAGAARAGVMHCFGGGPALAQGALALGFYISFAGNVTFKKADALREVAAEVSPDRLLVETDCPYLSPVPFRGRRNEPAHVVETARFLADLRGVTTEELGRVTAENFSRLFGVGLG
ncbi:MAG TPA: TatD family hydrolase, partial [Pyrinomonadaceae bacterium]